MSLGPIFMLNIFPYGSVCQHNPVGVIVITVRYKDGKTAEWIVQKRRQRNKSAQKNY